MDILHLTYFTEVARQKSFTKASKILHVTQPSISKVIKTLENELDVILLERSGRQVELTDAGQALFQQAQNVLIAMANLTTKLTDIVGLKKGRLIIGLPPMIGARFFPNVIGEFKRIYPNIEIKLIEVGSKQVESNIEDGSLDLGVVALPLSKDIFEVFPFSHESLQVVLYPNHSLAGKLELSLSDLRAESFILYHNDFSLNDLIISKCNQQGFVPHIVCQSSQWDFIAEMVSAKLGIAFLPETICQALEQQRYHIIPLIDPVIPWDLAIVWQKGKYLSFAAREWLKFTKNHFKSILPLNKVNLSKKTV
jgi:DNA-binding transcriptional LysR family regulator